MAAELDFPPLPAVGQKYTGPTGVVYEWNGYGWVIGFYDVEGDQDLNSLGAFIGQVRILLQDTDNSSGSFRYSDASIVLNLNQGLWEMFRLRPDIFLELDFKVPVFNAADLSTTFAIEQQYIPPLIYFVVGLTQIRDDEGTQDTRAAAFMQRFTVQLMTVNA